MWRAQPSQRASEQPAPAHLPVRIPEIQDGATKSRGRVQRTRIGWIVATSSPVRFEHRARSRRHNQVGSGEGIVGRPTPNPSADPALARHGLPVTRWRRFVRSGQICLILWSLVGPRDPHVIRTDDFVHTGDHRAIWPRPRLPEQISVAQGRRIHGATRGAPTLAMRQSLFSALHFIM